MIEAPHYTAAGAKKGGSFALPGAYFDGDVNEAVLHQAVRTFLNNQRQGTAATKTRSFVSGGNQKPWKQKGTGRARAGSSRSPLWRGGGIVFGPSPRDYRTDIPRKVRLLARRSAFNARAATGDLFVVEALAFEHPKTGQLVELLGKLGVDGRKVLILTHGVHEAVYLSSRNLPRVDVMNYAEATAYDVLWADVVVVEEGAFGDEPTPAVRTFTPAPKTAATGERPPRAPKAAKPKAEKPAKAEKPRAEKPKAEAKKPAAKKPVKSEKAEKPKSSVARKPAAKKPAPKKKGGK
jgi:large subunit ribosomal protein L4